MSVRLSFSARQPCDERLEQVHKPTKVIIGSKDRDFPDPVSEGSAIAEPTGGKLELVEGAGHYPRARCPKRPPRF